MVAGSITSMLFSLEKNLRLEWFIKGFIEVGTSKRLFDSERNSRDMRLVKRTRGNISSKLVFRNI
jgi:hypothetical protein